MEGINMKRLNILFLLLLLFVASAIGQQIVQPDSVRIAAWDAFKEREGESWNIRWDEQSGLPRTIVGGLTKEYRGKQRPPLVRF